MGDGSALPGVCQGGEPGLPGLFSLGCKIDVVTEAAISPYIREQVLNEAVALCKVTTSGSSARNGTIGEFRTVQDFCLVHHFHKLLEISETFLRRSIDWRHCNTASSEYANSSRAIIVHGGAVVRMRVYEKHRKEPREGHSSS
jgi:hypothetical protein